MKLVISVFKGILLKAFSEKLLEWLFFWAAQMLVDSTKTTKDNEFLAQVKKIYAAEDTANEQS